MNKKLIITGIFPRTNWLIVFRNYFRDVAAAIIYDRCVSIAILLMRMYFTYPFIFNFSKDKLRTDGDDTLTNGPWKTVDRGIVITNSILRRSFHFHKPVATERYNRDCRLSWHLYH